MQVTTILKKMIDKLHKDPTFQSQKDKLYSLLGLMHRRFMTPSYFSKLVLLAILPAQWRLEKEDPLPSYQSEKVEINRKTYDLKVIAKIFNGLETVELNIYKGKKTKYVIFCCGNSQDAKDLYSIQELCQTRGANYIFWNYPGVQNSSALLSTTADLYNACYSQVQRLLNNGVSPEQITLYGHSLGGSVAVHTAERLYIEGKAVNLTVDRSFSRISAVPSYIVKNFLNDYEEINLRPMAPRITSVVAFGIAGIGLGIASAGFIASISLILENLINAVAYVSALAVQLLGLILNVLTFNIFNTFLNKIFAEASLFINKYVSKLAFYVGQAVNFIGFVVGGLIALGGLLTGALIGGVIGAFLSIQLLWTDYPITMPMTPSFYFALIAACCEMDSVTAMRSLMKTKTYKNNQPIIEIYNAIDDEIIDEKASLNFGLGFKKEKLYDTENSKFLRKKMNSFWYRQVGHCLPLSEGTKLSQDDIIDFESAVY